MGINLNINETIIKVLTFKSVSKDMLTYFLNRTELRESWQKIIHEIPLEKTNGNGRVTNIEETLDLVMKSLAKLLLPEIQRQIAMTPRVGMGLIEMPKLTPREILEAYLKT